MKYKKVYNNLEIKVEKFKKLLEDDNMKLRFSSSNDLNLNFFQILSIIKNAKRIGLKSDGNNIGSYNTIYVVNGLVFKFSNSFLEDIKKFDIQNRYFKDSLEDLLEKKTRFEFNKNSLPLKIIRYKNCPVGVVYEYHKDYNDFFNLINEDYTTIFKCFYELNLLIRELADAGIYYQDFKLENVLYKNGTVKIIDFDSPIVNNGPTSMVDSIKFGLRNEQTLINESYSLASFGLVKILFTKIALDTIYKDRNIDELASDIKEKLLTEYSRNNSKNRNKIDYSFINYLNNNELISRNYGEIHTYFRSIEMEKDIADVIYGILNNIFIENNFKIKNYLVLIEDLLSRINGKIKKNIMY